MRLFLCRYPNRAQDRKHSEKSSSKGALTEVAVTAAGSSNKLPVFAWHSSSKAVEVLTRSWEGSALADMVDSAPKKSHSMFFIVQDDVKSIIKDSNRTNSFCTLFFFFSQV